MIEPSLSEREAARDGIQKAAGRMIWRYVSALSLIALLSMTAFVGTRQIIREQDESSTVINISARQRTLAQQIAHHALRMVVDEDPEDRAAARAGLAHAVDLMEHSHRALIHGDPELELQPESRPELRRMYFAPPLELDVHLSDFLLSAASLAALPDGSLDRGHPDLRQVLDAASGPLMAILDEAVHRYEQVAKLQVDELRRTERAIFLTTLLVLILEATLIFRPMVARVRLEASRFLESQDALERMAHHDELTGLPNRTLFQIRLDLALAQAKRTSTLTAILQLDLDHFKDINDTLGHPAGDYLLREMARRLDRTLRATDTVARLGGDEFALILTDLRSLDQVTLVAEKIVRAVACPVHYGEHCIHTSASIGITVFPTDDDKPEQLLKNADIALYQAKANGRNGFAYFMSEMKARVERRAQLEGDLRRALVSREFEAHYQPILRLEDRQLVGFEVLLRWRHPTRGLLTPQTFLGIAEEAGLITPIGFAILEQACRLLRRLDEQLEGPPLRMAVNFADKQLRAQGFLETFDAVLAEVGITAERIEIEITEGVMVGRSTEKATLILEQLRHRGASLALDDFGTGQASLTHLKRVKVDRLKIDRSFVRDIGSDPEDAAIVRAVTNLGHSLALEVIAEGIENDDQLAFLKLQGCDLGQGYLFGRAMPEPELLAFLDGSGGQRGDAPALALSAGGSPGTAPAPSGARSGP